MTEPLAAAWWAQLAVASGGLAVSLPPIVGDASSPMMMIVALVVLLSALWALPANDTFGWLPGALRDKPGLAVGAAVALFVLPAVAGMGVGAVVPADGEADAATTTSTSMLAEAGLVTVATVVGVVAARRGFLPATTANLLATTAVVPVARLGIEAGRLARSRPAEPPIEYGARVGIASSVAIIALLAAVITEHTTTTASPFSGSMASSVTPDILADSFAPLTL